jgi:hypothetical protein
MRVERLQRDGNAIRVCTERVVRLVERIRRLLVTLIVGVVSKYLRLRLGKRYV